MHVVMHSYLSLKNSLEEVQCNDIAKWFCLNPVEVLFVLFFRSNSEGQDLKVEGWSVGGGGKMQKYFGPAWRQKRAGEMEEVTATLWPCRATFYGKAVEIFPCTQTHGNFYMEKFPDIQKFNTFLSTTSSYRCEKSWSSTNMCLYCITTGKGYITFLYFQICFSVKAKYCIPCKQPLSTQLQIEKQKYKFD